MTKFNINRTKTSFLKGIQKHLRENISLTSYQCKRLDSFLDSVSLENSSFIKAENWGCVDHSLKNWEKLFSNLPGYDYVGVCHITLAEDVELLKESIVLSACFAPTMTYNVSQRIGSEIRLKENGTAVFWFPTLEDAEQYPELQNFKGTWKEAYLLLIETLKKGWPMEEFPEELLPLLRK